MGLGIGVVEAAIFRHQQRLHLRIVERFEDLGEIGRHAEHDRQRLLDVGGAERLDQSGMDLVPGVERHPAAVDVERTGADLAAAELLEDDPAVDDLAAALDGRAADIAIAVRRLAARQLADDVADALAHRGVAGLRVHERAGRKIMAQ